MSNFEVIDDEDNNESLNDDSAVDESAFNESLNETIGSMDSEEKAEVIQEAQALIAGLSEQELRSFIEKANKIDAIEERLRKTHDTAFGKIGSIEQRINEFKAGTGTPRQLTKADFSEVAAYLDDEDLTEALAKDLSKLVLGGGQQAQSTAAIEEYLEKFQKDIRSEMEMKLLTSQHPDWIQLANTPDFETWMNALKPEDRDLVGSTNDATVMSNAFSSFKKWQKKKAEKSERLESAIPTKTSGGSGRRSASDDAFTQGLRDAGIKI